VVTVSEKNALTLYERQQWVEVLPGKGRVACPLAPNGFLAVFRTVWHGIEARLASEETTRFPRLRVGLR
jgi:hypothetical protein